MGGIEATKTIVAQESAPRPGAHFARRVFVALLVLHAGLVGYGIIRDFPTRDETAHVPAGVVTLTTGTFSLYRVNPPLPRALAALPLLAADPDTSTVGPSDRLDYRDEWNMARRFADSNAARYLMLMRLARLAGVAWSLLGAWLIWRWAGELYGPTGAVVGTALWCLNPMVLSQARYVTPDVPAAVAALGATYLYRRHLRRPQWDIAFLSGAALGAAQLCKFTNLFLLPVWGVLAVAHRRSRGGPPSSWPTEIGYVSIIAATCWAVLNIGYMFDGTFIPLRGYEFNSELLGGPYHEWNRFKETILAEVPVPLPYDYVVGIDTQRVDFEGKVRSFLCGQWRRHGWWYWYIYATAVKTPLGGLLLGAAALAAAARRRTIEDFTVWLPAMTLLALVSSQTGMTMHFRYLLPAMPFAVIGTSRVGAWLTWPGWRRWIAAGLLGWSLVSVLRVYPHTPAYFNEIAGGPDHGWRRLTDSNVDWGQSLLDIRDWAAAHPEARPLGLVYWNFVDYRLSGLNLPDIKDLLAADGQQIYLAVSVCDLVNGFGIMQQFTPIDSIGYTTLVYRLTPAEAAKVRRALGLEPAQ